MPSLLARCTHLLAPPFCWGCGGGAPAGQPLCGGCRAELRWLGPEPVVLDGGMELWAPLAYEGPARAVVRGLKYRGAPGLARPMAAAVIAGAPGELLHPRASLVPVPITRVRRRKRGFNQARALCDRIAEVRGLPVADCLARSGGRGHQVGRAREERLGAAAGTVRARTLAPPRVVLVDDVVTTGATLLACEEALRAAGAREVAAVAYARTPGR